MTTKEILNYFREEYHQAYDVAYPVMWGKDMAIMKRLVKIYSDEILKNYISEYFKLDDKFVQDAGHTINLLSTSIPKIQAQFKKRTNETVVKTSDAAAIAAVAQNLDTDGDF